MKSVNKVILIGTLGRDPEMRSTASGMNVAKFSIATNERYKDRDGQWQERTEWHNIVCWQRLAEIVRDYTHKGDRIYVEGRLQTSSWDDKQTGEKKYKTEIVANDLVLIGGKQGAGGGEGGGQRARGASADYNQSAPAFEEPATGITDEDIPF
jgi:single-strand DNA-binding protein